MKGHFALICFLVNDDIESCELTCYSSTYTGVIVHKRKGEVVELSKDGSSNWRSEVRILPVRLQFGVAGSHTEVVSATAEPSGDRPKFTSDTWFGISSSSIRRRRNRSVPARRRRIPAELVRRAVRSRRFLPPKCVQPSNGQIFPSTIKIPFS